MNLGALVPDTHRGEENLAWLDGFHELCHIGTQRRPETSNTGGSSTHMGHTCAQSAGRGNEVIPQDNKSNEVRKIINVLDDISLVPLSLSL